MKSNGPRVLAIGIDAAEPTLVRKLIEHGEMPALKRLLDEGQWLQVEAPAAIGSGAVWPTFVTGTLPATHGIYGEWCWQPDTMGLNRYSGRQLTPFWKQLAQDGVTVGVLDVPFTTLVGFTEGFEISEWWAHDSLEGRTQVGPERINEIIRSVAPHPLSTNRIDTAAPEDLNQMRKLGSACLEGVRTRGQLAKRLIDQTGTRLTLIVFPEIHHSAHHFWHLITPNDAIYCKNGFQRAPRIEPSLIDIHREVDNQIGRLAQGMTSRDTVLVFSLHGMRPALGLPSFLGRLLREWGFAALTEFGDQSWRQRALELMAGVKRRTPTRAKNFYYRMLPQEITHQLAQPTMLPNYDWEHTRAFALPTDQHGWIRVNLAGREVRGCVTADEYPELCDQLEEMLRTLRTSEGKRLVRDVIRTAPDIEAALPNHLPDLVVHWEAEVFSTPLKLDGITLESHLVGKKFTGQHAPYGFCVWKGHGAPREATGMQASEFHRFIEQALREG